MMEGLTIIALLDVIKTLTAEKTVLRAHIRAMKMADFFARLFDQLDKEADTGRESKTGKKRTAKEQKTLKASIARCKKELHRIKEEHIL